VTLCSQRSACRRRSPFPRRWSLDDLAIDNAAFRTCLRACPFAIKHQRHIIDRPEQRQPNKAPKPPKADLVQRRKRMIQAKIVICLQKSPQKQKFT
jgi:hypothetical protein